MNTDKALISVQGLSTLERPRFSPGLLLEADDLTASVDYTRDLMRLMFRSLFGCGVVCGLEVESSLTCRGMKVKVTIKKGLALDCMGNAIQICKQQTLTLDFGCTAEMPRRLYVLACYVEKCCNPRDVSCSADGPGQTVATRGIDGFEITLYDHLPKCACACMPRKTNGEGNPAEACEDNGRTEPLRRREEDAERGSQRFDDTRHCECYGEHNRGVCDCGCDCNCVLLAIIDTEPSEIDRNATPIQDLELKVNMQVRRQVRPVLTGFLPCLVHKSEENDDHERDRERGRERDRGEDASRAR